MFDFEVKIAQNEKEIEQALRLRYEIFKLEWRAILLQKDAPELDKDIYDEFYDHLIVMDKIANKVVGTYRLCLSSKVNKKIGFYSENFFDIHNVKRLAEEYEILELGRSCIHKDYRSKPTISLLWSGIAKYIKDNNVRYLFGSVSLLNNDPLDVSKNFKFIQERFYAPDKFRVYPKPETKFKDLKKDIDIEDHKTIFRRLPPLIKGYLRLGVLVCGEPAINPELGSVLIFILLDTHKIPYSYRQHFY